MTVEEAARYLFVSRAHVLKLLAIGKLVERSPRSLAGQPDIDFASVEAYCALMEAARRTWQDSQTEDNDPLGL